MVAAFYGMGLGWLYALLLARSDLIVINSRPPLPGAILNFCYIVSYPKMQDFFWYAVSLASGFLGAVAVLWCRKLAAKSGGKADYPWAPYAGLACMLSAFLLGLTEHHAKSAPVYILSLGALALPWLGRNFRGAGITPPPAATKKPRPLGYPACIAAAIVIATIWMYDPHLTSRPLDTVHEGTHLCYVESMLSGQKPGLDFVAEYGPLNIASLYWFMKSTSLTVPGERRYFQLVQTLGGAILLFILGSLGGIQISTLLCACLALFMSTLQPFQNYGWANALRSALPLLAIWLCWRGVTAKSAPHQAASGILFAISWFYSTEYAAAGIAGCTAILAVTTANQGARVSLPAGIRMLAAGIASSLAILALIYGADMLAAARGLISNSYMGSRLSGAALRPFPEFIWFTGLERSLRYHWSYLWVVSIWAQGLVCCMAGVWLFAERAKVGQGNHLLLLALIPASLIAQIPTLVRPTAQIYTSAPFTLAILSIIFPELMRRGRKWTALCTVIFLILLFCHAFNTMSPQVTIPKPRFLGATEKDKVMVTEIPRMGNLLVDAGTRKLLLETVLPVKSATKEGDEILVTVFRFPIITFLANRPGTAPYPTPILAASPQERALFLKALEERKPKVAVWTETGMEVNFRETQPHIYRYIKENYKPHHNYEGIFVQLRR